MDKLDGQIYLLLRTGTGKDEADCCSHKRIAAQPTGAIRAHSGSGTSSADAPHFIFRFVLLIRFRTAQPPAAHIK